MNDCVFVPVPMHGGRFRGWTSGSNSEGFHPGDNISVFVSTATGSLVVSTTSGESRGQWNAVAARVARRHLDAGGAIPVDLLPLQVSITVDDDSIAFTGVACGEAWAVISHHDDVDVTIEASGVNADSVRLVRIKHTAAMPLDRPAR